MSALQANPFLMAGGVGGGYEIERSLRFNSADSAFLSRAQSSGNTKTFTYSFWMKKVGAQFEWPHIIGADQDSNNRAHIRWNSDKLQCYFVTGNSTKLNLQPSRVFRDYGAWFHVVLAVDSTQATTSNRAKLYINGELQSAFDYSIYPSQNDVFSINNSSATAVIGRRNYDSSNYINGYLADVHFIDGQALAPTDFGETDDNGVWQPIEYAGTYGTNGFHLDFKDNSSASALGNDAAGSNNWTVNNLSVAAGSGNDSLVDSPSQIADQTDTGAGGEVVGNYCTLNPLRSNLTLTNGNLDSAGGSGWTGTAATIGMSSGQWYWEIDNIVSDEHIFGIIDPTQINVTWNTTYGYGAETGGKYRPGLYNQSYGSSYSTNDVIGIAFDADNGSLTFYKNGTSQGTAFTGLTDGPYFPSVVHNGSSRTSSINFGQRAFAYTAPSGYKALCTANLPEPTIADGSQYFDTKLWSGTSSAQSISSLAFAPDFVWIKRRSASYGHVLVDTVRGLNNGHAGVLYSSANNAEDTGATQSVTAFNSNGFTLGTDGGVNSSGSTYAAWTWDAGSSTVSNTDGSITSQVRANPSAGFSIVTYTGTGSSASIGHGLNDKPRFVIVKSRSNGYSWIVWHGSFVTASNTDNLFLSATGARGDYNYDFWNNTAPTSSVVNLGTQASVNASGATYVSYCFAPVAGYSAMGSYVGNGSDDGPFVYTGFRPAFVLTKVTSRTGTWLIWDTKRGPYNTTKNTLSAETSATESTAYYDLDILSNGFKIRNSYTAVNSTHTYVYAAFAENPFKTARAR